MARFGFCGPTYASASLIADAQRCVNWLPEKIESELGKTAIALYPLPGLKVFCVLPDFPVREVFTFLPPSVSAQRTFAIAGDTLYEIFSTGTFIQRGLVSSDGGKAYMVANGNQGVIASGGHAYLLDMTLNTLTDLTATGTLGAVAAVAYSDTFFLALLQNSNQWFASAANNGASWPGTSFNAVSVFPDRVLAIIVDHREVWLFGPTRSQVHYDSGASPFPFDVATGAFLEYGIAAPATAKKLDNSVLWLGADENGWAVAVRAQGYTPARISNHAVEQAWASYPTVADAVGYCYQYQGHPIWQLYFPSANSSRGATWGYDVATNLWHERDHLFNGQSFAHQSQCHAFAFNKHLVGANDSGTIYEMGTPSMSGSTASFCDDAGNPIRRMRRAPHISSEQQWIFHNQLQVDVEVGLATFTDGAGNPRAPQLMLRWSDDGGKTYSNEHSADCGKLGEYKARAIWRRLGRSRDRVYEVAATDAIPWRIIDAYLNTQPGAPPQKRLPKELAERA